MTSANGKLPGGKSSRQKLAASLTSRERRGWFTRLASKQEEVEKAQDALNALMVEAWEAGMSYEAISGAIGLHATSTRDRIVALYREMGKLQEQQST